MRIVSTLCLVVIAGVVVLAFGDVAADKFLVYRAAFQIATAAPSAADLERQRCDYAARHGYSQVGCWK